MSKATLIFMIIFNLIVSQKDNINTNNDAKRRLVHRLLNLAIEKAVYQKWNQKFEVNKCLKFVEDKKCKLQNPCDCPENFGKESCIIKKCEQKFKLGNFDKDSPCYVCKKNPIPEKYKEICNPIVNKCKDINVEELLNLDEESFKNFQELCDKHRKDCQIMIESKTIKEEDKNKCCNEKMKKLFPNYFKTTCHLPPVCKDKNCKTCLERANEASKAGKKIEDMSCLKEICIAGNLLLVQKVGNEEFHDKCEDFHKECEDREWIKNKDQCTMTCKDLEKFLNTSFCSIDCTNPKHKDHELCKEEPTPEDKCKHVYYLMKDIVTMAKEGTVDKDIVKKTLNKDFCEKDIFLTDITEYEKKCSEIAINDLKIQGALSKEEFQSKIAELKKNGFIETSNNKLKKESKVSAKSLLA